MSWFRSALAAVLVLSLAIPLPVPAQDQAAAAFKPEEMEQLVAPIALCGGFALVAFPAQYGVSGVMTFIVNHDGVVYQKDLGPNSATVAEAMRQFNPDAGWTKAQPV